MQYPQVKLPPGNIRWDKSVDIYDIRRERLKLLIDEEFDGNGASFARHVKRQPDYINRLLSTNKKHRKRLGEELAREFETRTGKARDWLDVPPAAQPRADYVVLGGGASAGIEDNYVFIENKGWRGSCGGGRVNWDEVVRKPLAFQREWLSKKGLSVDNSLLIYADGDSMIDFIQDGDAVLFNSGKTLIKSGEIFAIEHPEGTKIKRLRLDFDGSLILSSDNPDKKRFPDDRVPPAQIGTVKVLGQFVWRGGG